MSSTHSVEQSRAGVGPPAPRWVRAGRILGFGLTASGLVMVLVAWTGVRNAFSLLDQLSYVASGGVGGIFCIGLGATLVVASDLALSGVALSRLEDALDAIKGGEEGSRERGGSATGSRDPATGAVELDSHGGSSSSGGSAAIRAAASPGG